ncbi:ABC transporter permease [Microvirga tunisiensis]|uniref:ABC transporter permease n=1 Tax=Microvirga tunisiensis TaxID=2108360 RepID=A0A5N7MW38_9HYPH|nr:ABC transporter permease [Microvirga tunisiensis]MPR05443.1 ABC transporter permease [Microvirga tunisiensis]MPR30304.1 ABC transporter permease [Microvirga tunisiensis]
MSNIEMTSGRATDIGLALDEDQVFTVDPSIKARRREAIIVIASRVILAVLVLSAWEWVSGRWISDFWISSPSRIVVAFVKLLSSGSLVANISVTMLEAVVGFAIGVVAGMTMGVICGANRLIARILDPYLVGFYSLPRIALIPLFILWFGIGLQTKVIYTALLVFFPVFMNTLSGVRDVSQDLIDVIRVMGASRADTVKKILIPSALAWLFAGLRISVPYALVGAIVAEMFTSNVGLGYMISFYANQFDTASLFATLAITTALGLLVNAIVGQIEKHLLRWKPATL